MTTRKAFRLILCVFIVPLLVTSCSPKPQESIAKEESGTYLLVLGVAQDAGMPQIGCTKSCCTSGIKKMVSSLGLYDGASGSRWIFDATPDLPEQWGKFIAWTKSSSDVDPEGIFLTHAHIGHYTGLMYLGLEAAHASHVRVYVMPRMMDFLQSNGPWSQLVKIGNILPVAIQSDEWLRIAPTIQVRPLLVPHRDEFSETVGYEIVGSKRSALFLPDINKWSQWKFQLSEMVDKHDYLFLDGTFFSGDELPGRDISKVPHPFVLETMEILKSLSPELKRKVYFTHLNHTNPLLQINSSAEQIVKSNGFNIAAEGMRFDLDR
ncbi:MAG: pyrroloquinoline quinone biosynthesis protein PqqB [Bacteroidetes bacterium]|nr:pyrroloquinoline quinone biosynthesis protein PqqB [Bacteroidota bacterium]